jgi:hypothetical protein
MFYAIGAKLSALGMETEHEKGFMQLSKISNFYRQRMEKRPTDFGKMPDMKRKCSLQTPHGRRQGAGHLRALRRRALDVVKQIFGGLTFCFHAKNKTSIAIRKYFYIQTTCILQVPFPPEAQPGRVAPKQVWYLRFTFHLLRFTPHVPRNA